MAQTTLDLVGIGNAVVDMLTHTDDVFLVKNNLAKGAMTLVDADQAHKLYDEMGPAVEVSGGSASNTMAGFASLGGNGAFVGKVRNDQLGGIFSHDIQAAGVRYETPLATSGAPTARCLIFVTPDAQRTMQTYLGASVALGPDDINEELIASARVTYLEGYLWASDSGREAIIKAAKIAAGAGNKVSFTLSDAFLVDAFREDFLSFICDHVDILFANEVEITALVEAQDFDDSFQHTRGLCEIAALTRSEKGSVIAAGEEIHVIDAAPVEQVVDTTGAGDLYAAGFLYGYTRNRDLAACAHMGSLAAGEIISHFGARPETPLAGLLPPD
ncbi:MAG: adenosine kinase [Alphaproteobacteria bacterium]|jgi:sugar/nucleoside kinase (ribokinase family)|nr:adenosine kinase [Alphaproteobacteria bacterium]MDP6780863.1 adenosine kinase [Alphaproteobacteria bacterium]MDP7044146.1 adenosine kinase [Alphaproteobacteria bacterium]HAQ33426.1 adenosine kinase [Rhodospirillaceae bacterium]|tara:strand:+ start:1311 stop:2297 length:987 start_codon:yes stop_codon:yes gene_type:complete